MTRNFRSNSSNTELPDFLTFTFGFTCSSFRNRLPSDQGSRLNGIKQLLKSRAQVLYLFPNGSLKSTAGYW